MNILDIGAVVVAGYGIYMGWKNGAVKEIFGLLSVIIGLWAGIRLAFVFADYYKANYSLPEKSIPFIAFLSAFLIAVVLVILIGKVIDKIFDVTFDVPNKVAGGLLGLLKWMYIVGALFCILGSSGSLGDMRKNSATYHILTEYCIGVNEYTIGLIPSARNVFGEMDNYFTHLIPAEKSDSTETKP